MSLLEFLVLEVTLIFVGVIVYVIQVAMIDPYLYKLKMLNIIAIVCRAQCCHQYTSTCFMSL
jgi:hypothetical protein